MGLVSVAAYITGGSAGVCSGMFRNEPESVIKTFGGAAIEWLGCQFAMVYTLAIGSLNVRLFVGTRISHLTAFFYWTKLIA